ncbi:MAG TPA: leucine-rich repeat-containing protein kinase family protein [Asticcacaulis sp.]|nr:leucine-rich repeat-containing protein kinase family protein [Asticcacaulis sp.]
MHSLDDLLNGRLSGATHLKLSANLDAFPDAIFDLTDTLEILDLSGNRLSSLPHDLNRLHRLRILFCSNNRFTELPPGLGACESLRMIGFKANRIARVPPQALPPRLRWLILTDNAVETLPAELGQRPALQKLMLAGNRLSALPDLSACANLELLRLSANRFEALPPTLYALPRLTWLAYAGNPFTHAREAAALHEADLPHIDWSDLSLSERLGEGASGHIHAARWISRDQSVAVKIFKGDVTSDGLPQSELSAALAAGNHDGLIPLLGRAQSPEGRDALIMQRLPPSFRPLAGPPDFDTCTRDIYAKDTRLTTDQTQIIAADLASALSHLHHQGLTHGDLYAHNILYDGESALITDLGAASPLPADDEQRAFLQALDRRAYGVLMEELTKCSE